MEGFDVSLDWTAFFLGEGDALEAKSKKIIKKPILKWQNNFFGSLQGTFGNLDETSLFTITSSILRGHQDHQCLLSADFVTSVGAIA